MKNHKDTIKRYVLVVALGLSLAGCGPKSGKEGGDQAKEVGEATIPVEAAVATRKPITASYSGTAALEPENQAQVDRKSTRLNSSHSTLSRMPSSA